MSTTRELVLERLRLVLMQIRPGAVFPFPDGLSHAPITSNVAGRVYTRERPTSRLSPEETPRIEIVHDYGTPEVWAPADDSLYFAQMQVGLWGCCYADDAGDLLDTPLRPKLNALRSDMLIASEALQWWPDPTSPLCLNQLLGTGVVAHAATQWTEPGLDSAAGFVVLQLVIRYPINRRIRR